MTIEQALNDLNLLINSNTRFQVAYGVDQIKGVCPDWLLEIYDTIECCYAFGKYGKDFIELIEEGINKTKKYIEDYPGDDEDEF